MKPTLILLAAAVALLAAAVAGIAGAEIRERVMV